jgi:hypothetical protein
VEQDCSRILLTGLDRAWQRKRLSPLLRSIELCLDIKPINLGEKATVFSCDSFCRPHLDIQLGLWNRLCDTLNTDLTFFNFPVGHYISSIPELNTLSYSSRSSALLSINSQLVDQQNIYKENTSINQRIEFDSSLTQFSDLFDLLSADSPDDQWEELMINDFPFHELSFRDLSLTYKCLPSLCARSTDTFYRHFILMNKSILHQLCLLCLNSHRIGGLSFYMSDYSASSVFKFFCSSTGRTSRFFDKISIPNEISSAMGDCNIRILETAYDAIHLTNASHTFILNHFSLGKTVRDSWGSYLDSRIKGQGSHVYSAGYRADEPMHYGTDVLDWIENQSARGRKVISLFTSSPDELVGQQIVFSHAKLNISHLSNPIFMDQDDWVASTIRHFSLKDTSASLVIRFHPRLAADNRGLLDAPYFEEYFKNLISLCKLFPNILLVHPSHKISSYLIGFKSCFILNGWSTIGMELAAKGCKVLNAFARCTLGGGAFYPVHLNLPQLSTRSQYFSYVDALLADPVANADIFMNQDEALISFIVYYLRGLTNINAKQELLSQIARPQVITSSLINVLET